MRDGSNASGSMPAFDLLPEEGSRSDLIPQGVEGASWVSMQQLEESMPQFGSGRLGQSQVRMHLGGDGGRGGTMPQFESGLVGLDTSRVELSDTFGGGGGSSALFGHSQEVSRAQLAEVEREQEGQLQLDPSRVALEEGGVSVSQLRIPDGGFEESKATLSQPSAFTVRLVVTQMCRMDQLLSLVA